MEAYLNVHKDYDDEPVANITSATFAAQGPHCRGCIWNIAFDIWLGDGLSHELMIWTENFGQRPAGSEIDTFTAGGHTYEVWRSGDDGGIITYLSTTTQTSGTMPLAAFFADVPDAGLDPDHHLAGRLRGGDRGHQRHHPAVRLHQLPHLRLARGDVLTGTVAFGGSPRGNERWPDEVQPRARPPP